MMAIVTPTKAMHCNKDGGILPEGEPESWQGIFFYKIKKNQWDTSGGRAGELAGNGSFFTAGGGISHRHHFRYRNSIIIITTLKMINIIIIVKTSHLVGQAVGETQEPGLLPHTPALWAENWYHRHHFHHHHYHRNHHHHHQSNHHRNHHHHNHSNRHVLRCF